MATHSVALLLAAALVSLAAAITLEVPGTLTAGSSCSTSSLNGVSEKCLDGLTCVISMFGMPATFIENAGVCRDIPTTTSPCSVAYCSSVGYTQECATSTSPFAAAQCGAWATRADGGPKPNCVPCTATACADPKPLASNGKYYCSLCELQYESCKADFKFRGPLANPPPAPAKFVSKSIGAVAGANEAPEPQVCSTSGDKGNCPEGSVCLVTKFGESDNTGKCVPSGTYDMCTIAYCANTGPNEYCTTPFSSFTTSCNAWATRMDYGMKPNCGMSCTRNCDPVATQVKDNKGTAHCSPCALRKASCESNFVLFGIVTNPVAQPEFMCTTNNPTNGSVACTPGYKCCINFFGYPMGGVANVGTCELIETVGDCTTAYCAGKDSAKCNTVDTLDYTTCQAWAARSDGGI